MKKIFVIYTGGTIGMQPTSSGYAPAENLMALLQEKIPPQVMGQLPAFELFEYPELIDSSNIQPRNWQQIAQDIIGRYEQYDGFVVLHGTDTMAYSCSMLSFMLQNLKKPVIFTGSQIPLCEARTDGVENFTGALTMAADERIHEVCLYFNNSLLRGNRTTKVNCERFDAFNTPNYPQLGRSDIQIQLNQSLLQQPKGPETFTATIDAIPHVLPLFLFPGISAEWMQIALSQPYDAFILKTYGTGNGPDLDKDLLSVLSDASCRGKIIINQTQCLRGAVVPSAYAAGSALEQAGLLSGYDMTLEACFCKLHFLFSCGLITDDIKEKMAQNLTGEMTL